jgi:hypothetical protein
MTTNIKLRFFAFTCLTCLLLLTQSSFASNGESLTYSIIKGNSTIGSIRIDRSTKNDFTEYSFESTAKLNLLLSFEVYDRMRVLFRGPQLIQAKLYRTLNGKVKVDNTATWNGSSYRLFDKDGHTGSIDHQIYATTASLYFFEPLNSHAVFSEKFQQMIPIKRVGEKKYALQLPNGNKVTYTYSNGICSLVEADTDWASVKFVLNVSK